MFLVWTSLPAMFASVTKLNDNTNFYIREKTKKIYLFPKKNLIFNKNNRLYSKKNIVKNLPVLKKQIKNSFFEAPKKWGLNILLTTRFLPDKAESHLRQGVSLSEHAVCGICQNLVTHEVCHFGCNVNIGNAGF